MWGAPWCTLMVGLYETLQKSFGTIREELALSGRNNWSCRTSSLRNKFGQNTAHKCSTCKPGINPAYLQQSYMFLSILIKHAYRRSKLQVTMNLTLECFYSIATDGSYSYFRKDVPDSNAKWRKLYLGLESLHQAWKVHLLVLTCLIFEALSFIQWWPTASSQICWTMAGVHFV